MQNCLHCGKKNFWSSTGRFENGRREFRCRNCGEKQLEVPPQGLRIPPKILYFDIEVSLCTYEVYGPYVRDSWLRSDQKIEDWYIITWAAGWVNDADFAYVFSERVRDTEAKARDDKRCLTRLWELMDAADYVVGHNSDKYDVKKAHYRFVVNGMGLPYKSKQVDTLKMAKKYFSADSNKLDEWARLFGGNGKKIMDYEDWSRINRDPVASDLQKMEDYCRQDVREGAMVFREFLRLVEGRGDRVLK